MSTTILNERPLVLGPALASIIGLREAILLQQIYYWTSLEHNKNVVNDKVWVYKTYNEWKREFPFWSLSTINRTLASLRQQNLIFQGCYSENKRDRTVWYTVNQEAVRFIMSEWMNAATQKNELEDLNESSPFTQSELIPFTQNECMHSLKVSECIKEHRLHTETTTENNKTRASARAVILDDKLEDLNDAKTNFKKSFSVFWELYPAKKGRQGAETAFLKAKCHLTLPKILKALESQILEKSKKEELGLFCPEWPHPATWLNQKRWEDEVSPDWALQKMALAKSGSSMSAREKANSAARNKVSEVMERMNARVL